MEGIPGNDWGVGQDPVLGEKGPPDQRCLTSSEHTTHLLTCPTQPSSTQAQGATVIIMSSGGLLSKKRSDIKAHLRGRDSSVISLSNKGTKPHGMWVYAQFTCDII